MIDEELLIEKWENTKKRDLAKLLGCSVAALYRYAKKLGLEKEKQVNHHRRWSKKEIEKLRTLYESTIYLEDIGKQLNRSTTAVVQKLSSINLLSDPFWTNEEIELLEEKYPLFVNKDLLEYFPNRTICSIKSMAIRLDLKKEIRIYQDWTQEEKDKLKELFLQDLSCEEISKIMLRTEQSVNSHLKPIRAELNKWTDEEIELLKEKYENTEIKELLKLFPNRKNYHIGRKARSLGLKKPPSLLWSEEEVELLKEKYPISTIKELLEIFPDKEKKQINWKAKKYKLKKTEETLLRSFCAKDLSKIPALPTPDTQWRRKILRRDQFTCKDCGLYDKTGIYLHAHHIIPQRDCSIKQLYDVNNGITLCIECHHGIHFKEHEHKDRFLEAIE